MNILMLTYQGGSTKSMIYLSTGLASRGHNVFFGCRKESTIYQSLLDGSVSVFPISFSRFGGCCPAQIADLCREQHIQIINAPSGHWKELPLPGAGLFVSEQEQAVHSRHARLTAGNGNPG